MRRIIIVASITGGFLFGLLMNANATLISVSGPVSNLGDPAVILASAPENALDDGITNTSMTGFNEAQGVVTTKDYRHDYGNILAGTLVDSHMIFLNSAKYTILSQYGVVWGFDSKIIGVMSDNDGNFEFASTPELGAEISYGEPFDNRGFENPNPNHQDWYTVSTDGYSINVNMYVTEPGDWMRVVTAPVPEPATMLLFGTGLIGLVGVARRKKK